MVSRVERIPFSLASAAQARATPADMASRPLCSAASSRVSTAAVSVTPSMLPSAKMGS